MPLPSSTRWRLNISASWGGNSTSVASFAMASSYGGADLCTGGTPSADSVWPSAGYEADKAFDGNAGTRWNNSGASMPAWLQYQFASAVTIVEYKIQAGTDYAGGNPKTWTFEYFDGSAWVVWDTQTAVASWTTGEIRTYSISVAPASSARVSQDAIDILSQPTPSAVVTQDAIDILSQPTSIEARVSQDAIEILSANVAAPPSAASASVTQVVTETISLPTPAARVTQLVAETITAGAVPAAAARLTQLVAEVVNFLPPAAAVKVTQLVAELLTLQPPAPGRVSQSPLEILGQPPAAARVSQTAVEFLDQLPPVPGYVSQMPLEFVEYHPPVEVYARVSQAAVEIIYPFGCYVYVPPDCPEADFPVDPDDGGGSCPGGILP